MTKLVILLIAAMFLLTALPAYAGGVSDNLMLSSSWCTFSYNKVTGYSKSTRYSFNRDGTWRMGGRSEGYSSGSGGSMGSQRNSGAGGRWKVMNGELFLSEGYGQLQHVQTNVKRNNNGYYVVVADGVEYSQCR